MSRWLLTLACLGNVSCEETCGPPGVQEGERFRFTLIERVHFPCQPALPVTVGFSYEVKVGYVKQESPPTCEVPTLVHKVPPFSADLVPICSTESNFGWECRSVPSDAGCGYRLHIGTSAHFEPGQQVLENESLVITWWAGCDFQCIEEYRARVERLGS